MHTFILTHEKFSYRMFNPKWTFWDNIRLQFKVIVFLAFAMVAEFYLFRSGLDDVAALTTIWPGHLLIFTYSSGFIKCRPGLSDCCGLLLKISWHFYRFSNILNNVREKIDNGLKLCTTCRMTNPVTNTLSTKCLYSTVNMPIFNIEYCYQNLISITK